MSDRIARLKWGGLFMAALVLVATSQWSTGVYDRNPGLLLIVATFVVVAIVAILAFCAIIWCAVRMRARMPEDGKNKRVLREGPLAGLIVSLVIFGYAIRFMQGMDSFGLNANSVPFLPSGASLLESGARLGLMYVGLFALFGAAPFLAASCRRGAIAVAQTWARLAGRLRGAVGRARRTGRSQSVLTLPDV